MTLLWVLDRLRALISGDPFARELEEEEEEEEEDEEEEEEEDELDPVLSFFSRMR